MTERSLFLAALNIIDPAERSAYLDRACADEPALRAQVEQLLQAHLEPGRFMDRPAPVLVTAAEERPVGEGPGTVIGSYKLLEQIGEGGFGVVFMAEQHRPVRRKVAVKVLKPGMDTRQVVARFEAERQALALMDHPNIAHVLDGGETTLGRPYFVMELVRGVPITDFGDANHLSVRERLELFVPVCQAVQHAHQKGIIHRDLKPTNILVTLHDGTPVVKVIDFGIAKATGQPLTEKTLFTNFAQMLGTPLYMSPEQAQMSGLDIDTRTDIYSLGVLLYELLTGTTPFDKERLRTAAYDEVRRIIREEEPAKPSTRISTLGPAATPVSANRRSDPKGLSRLCRGELDWVVMKALEKDRARRYETASAFAADVQRFLHDEPVLACPPSLGYRWRKFARRYRGPVLAAALVLLALLGGIVGTTWGLVRAIDARADAESAAGQKEAALTAARRSERDAKDQLFLALWNQARAGRFSRQMGQRLDSLDALAQAARLRADERLRDEAIAALALPDIRPGPSWNPLPPGFRALAFDDQYRLYARESGQGDISVRRLPDDREVRHIVSAPSRVSGLWLSPDGRYVARLEDGYALKVWRVADGQPVLRDELRRTWGWAFSPDGRQLAVGQDGWAVRYDLAAGREVNRWRLPHKAHRLAFHPDNRRLAVGYASAAVTSVYDATTGRLVADLPVGAIQDQVLAWHPDGECLAVAGSDPCIQIWDVAARHRLATLEGHVQHVTILTFHPDGDLLASASWDGVLRLWEPATGRPLMQLPLAGLPQFSRDGRWLGVAYHGEQAQLLEVAPTREYRTLVSRRGAGQRGYGDGAISPDGRLLALSMNDGARLWHLPSGRELAMLPPGIPLFPPDGRELLTCGHEGLHRWPVQDGGPGAHELRLGPPRTVALPAVPMRAVLSPDGRTLAVVSEAGGSGLLLDLATESVPTPPLEHPLAGYVALSRDGQWLASGGWHAGQVRLWNARTGQRVREWPVYQAAVFFTPDSRTLVIARGDEFGFWDVATGEPIRRLRREVALYPGHVAFSPDGGLMALEMAPAVIHLKEVATGRTVAQLEDPHGDRSGWMGFTPDGTQLVVAAGYAKAVHVWDLRAIRNRLKAMGLDWDWPEFPAAPTPPSPAAGEGPGWGSDPPRKVEVLLGDLARTREQKAKQMIEKYQRAVAANPDSALACNNLAWAYLMAPQALRDVNAAVPLAEKAVRLASGSAVYRNTLGLAYYRAGRHREAVEVLRPNLESQEDAGLAYDLYALAMSHHRLGETARARDYYDWAVRWTRAQRGLSAVQFDELAEFRAEAEELFETDPKKD